MALEQETADGCRSPGNTYAADDKDGFSEGVGVKDAAVEEEDGYFCHGDGERVGD